MCSRCCSAINLRVTLGASTIPRGCSPTVMGRWEDDFGPPGETRLMGNEAVNRTTRAVWDERQGRRTTTVPPGATDRIPDGACGGARTSAPFYASSKYSLEATRKCSAPRSRWSEKYLYCSNADTQRGGGKSERGKHATRTRQRNSRLIDLVQGTTRARANCHFI